MAKKKVTKKYINVADAIDKLKDILDNDDLDTVAAIIGHAFGAKLWVEFVSDDYAVFEFEPVEGEYMGAFDGMLKNKPEEAV